MADGELPSNKTDGEERERERDQRVSAPFAMDGGLTLVYTGLSKINGAKLRESFCPAPASHSRPRQAGA